MITMTSGQFQILFRQTFHTLIANMKSRYRNSIAGFIWVILNPLLLFAAQGFAFHYILKIQMVNYPVFLLSGLLPWMFISQSLDMSIGGIVNSGTLLKAYPIHPLVCLLAQIFDNFINIFLTIMVIFIPVAWIYAVPFWKVLLMIVPLSISLIAVIGLSWFLATSQVFFRDTKFIASFAISVLFFLTPIFYPENFIDEPYRWILEFNPFRYLLIPFRDIIETPVNPDFALNCLVAFLISISTLTMALVFWRRKRNVVYFYL